MTRHLITPFHFRWNVVFPCIIHEPCSNKKRTFAPEHTLGLLYGRHGEMREVQHRLEERVHGAAGREEDDGGCLGREERPRRSERIVVILLAGSGRMER